MLHRRLIAVASLVVLAMIIMASTTPAWSATICPITPATSNVHPPSTIECSQELLEEGEERAEEELEVREDEEEERAIVTERAAKAIADAAEEAAEEAQEQARPEVNTTHPPHAKFAFTLRVRSFTRRGHSFQHPAETQISVATSVPLQVKLVLQTHGEPAKLFGGESAKGHKYILRVPWTCRTQARKYAFTVTAYREGNDQIGTGDTTTRRGAFTIDNRNVCSKNHTP